MLRWRLLLGIALIATLVWLCWLDGHASPPGKFLLPVALVFAVVATQEFIGLARARSLQPAAAVLYLGNLAITAANAVAPWGCSTHAGLTWPMLALALAAVAAFVFEMRRYERPGEVLERLAITVLGLSYIGACLSFVVQLRLWGDPVQGMAALVSLLTVVKMGDTGAYTIGRLVGRHKMTPVLSPGKTWEGAGGALLFGVLGAWLCLASPLAAQAAGRASKCAAWGWLAYGLAVAVAGIIGDLAESMLKRDAGRKDSSTWMPGFGGILDMLDSILLAAPVAYLLWLTEVVAF